MTLKKIVRPLVILFAVANAVLIAFKLSAKDSSIDFDLLIIANVVFFLLNLFVLYMQKNAWENTNPHVFLRAVTGGMMIKMLFCAALIIGYVLWKDNQYSIASIMLALAVYLIYLILEVRAVSAMNKRSNVEKAGRP